MTQLKRIPPTSFIAQDAALDPVCAKRWSAFILLLCVMSIISRHFQKIRIASGAVLARVPELIVLKAIACSPDTHSNHYLKIPSAPDAALNPVHKLYV
jgi:hypothetical protein